MFIEYDLPVADGTLVAAKLPSFPLTSRGRQLAPTLFKDAGQRQKLLRIWLLPSVRPCILIRMFTGPCGSGRPRPTGPSRTWSTKLSS